ncbi:hypothetical protein [Hymenobacter sp. PAMC 26628]|uniref:hypothetical protein n=1 Tax=Hymenobacter sp. PAMC 26628 TaxID=1484118 RepID=UPI0007703984|nr:hypothetical protein [Hymenobacter sp. PAMC 26628]AMJ67379.1 hypothetical protein AXW84_19595 [Hymenobacter sp. PAMC 26628]
MLFPVIDSLVAQADAELRLLRFQWALLSEDHTRPAFMRGLALLAEHQATRVLVDFTGMPPTSVTEEIWLAQHWVPGILRQACLLQAAMVFDNEYDLHNWAKMKNLLGPSHLRSFQFQFFDDVVAALHWLTDSDAAVQRLQAEWKSGWRTTEAPPG